MVLSFTMSLTGLLLGAVFSLLVSFVITAVSNHYHTKQCERELYEITGMTIDEFERWLDLSREDKHSE